MRRNFVLFSMILFLLLSACSIPTINKQSGTIGEGTQSTAFNGNGNGAENGTARSETAGGDPASNGTPAAKGKIDVTLYYQDGSGNVIPVTRGIERQEGIAAATVRGLIDSSSTREALQYYGLYPVLPQGTVVQGITIREGTATIDFNKKLLEYQSARAEKAIISSVVYTLTEFATIDRVRIMVNGYPQGKLKFNTDISGDLSRENVFINGDKVITEDNGGKFDIYLVKHINDMDGYYVPVSLELKTGQKENLPSNIINALGKDYDEQELYSGMPEGVQLLESGISGDTITLDLNEEVKNYGGNTREDAIVNQILYSMGQIKGVEKVKILIEGKEGILPEGTDLSDAFPVPAKINEIFK